MDYQPGQAITQYINAISAIQQSVMENQHAVLCQAAGRMADTIQNSGRIFLFGTGHSHLIAEEAFYRAGGLAAATPVFYPALMLHEDAHMSSRLERTPGIAEGLLDRYRPTPGEMLFIFSNSGVNHLPVALALDARQRGLFTVSVSALAYAHIAPQSALGKRLDEVCDLSIDNGGIPGDALLLLPGCDWRVGPSSTILGALLWNSLVVECVANLQARGWNQNQLPIFASLNMNGAAEHNQALLTHWRQLNPHL